MEERVEPTPEDVERVAEAIFGAEDWRQEKEEWADQDKEEYRRLARAALSAYLEPTTKKET